MICNDDLLFIDRWQALTEPNVTILLSIGSARRVNGLVFISSSQHAESGF